MAQDLNGAQVGMTPSNPVNNPRPNVPRGYNQFPQTYKFLATDRYGVYNPCYWVKAERGDVHDLNSVHDLHTYTLQSPMVSDVAMTKSFFKVPMLAIYPRTWEKQFTIPTQGDDVPSDSRALLNVTKLVKSLVSEVFTQVDTTSQAAVISWIRSVRLLELIASHGSLFERFNIHFNYRFYVDGEIHSFDSLLDNFIYPAIIEFAKSHSIFNQSEYPFKVYVRSSSEQSDTEYVKYVSPRRFLELLHSGDITFDDDWSTLPRVVEDYLSLTSVTLHSGYDNDIPDGYINIEPIIAYQLVCAQFATNDHVDFIYSAQLWRDNMQSITDLAQFPTFRYNGVTYQYDVMSTNIFNLMIDKVGDYDSVAYAFFSNLFDYQNSLRYGDYFTGVKPRPLAVGEYSAQVNNNEVSAIDITRSIQMQRLLNRVNLVGRKLGDYLAGIFGGGLPSAPKDVPVFLAHERFTIDGFETNNTGAAQFDTDQPNTITSHLRSSTGKYVFEVQIDEPCYLIGMNSYESMRVYSKTIDRFAFHHDRYDDFIPEMQYIGDQEVRQAELGVSSSQNPFGYVLRYMEYKQRYSYASGGFIENLPSWAFITDNMDGNPAGFFIGPDYIRSSPSEFDRFYKSLTGFSLGSYFHFIVAHTNVTAPLRKMEYAPEILK